MLQLAGRGSRAGPPGRARATVESAQLSFAQCRVEGQVWITSTRQGAHELRVTGGGHTWLNWRHYFHELAPRLFR